MKLALLPFLLVTTAAFSPAVQSSINAKFNTALDAVSRRDVLGWIPAAAFATLPAVANAADKTKTDKAQSSKAKTDEKNTEPVLTAIISNFPGVYSDPKHPKGYRVILSDGTRASMQLQDDPTGKVFSIPIKMKNDKKLGTLLTIDFSPKGGPKNIVGTVEKKGKISFPDGNVWTKATGIAGVYSDPNHPKGYRVIRKEGSTYIVTLNDSGSKGKEITIPAKSSGSIVVFDFSSKGGPANLKGSFKDGLVSFPDGNKWTKL